MAERLAGCHGNPYNCSLTILAPKGKIHTLECIVASLVNWVDPSKQVIRVAESCIEADASKSAKHCSKVNGCLISPAISVMFFMRETGKMCVTDIQRRLSMSPFQFHHKVELRNNSSPEAVLAKQEFYKLADDLPLFAACPVLTDTEHIRINIYVHNFSAMVEFYRLITDTEIETNKPEFCIFEIYQQPGLDIQLSLKRSQYIYPNQVKSAYISFNVKSINMIKTAMNCIIDHVGNNAYTTHDPDGNLVVLYETSFQHSQASASACSQRSTSASSCCGIKRLNDFEDLKSLKSTTESHDSGRYSDSDGTVVDTVVDNISISYISNNTSKRSNSVFTEERAIASHEMVSSSNLKALNSKASADYLMRNDSSKRVVELNTSNILDYGNSKPFYI